MATWHPDTCSCVLVYDAGAALGATNGVTTITKCRYHAALSDADAILAACDDNQLRSAAINIATTKFTRALTADQQASMRLMASAFGLDPASVPAAVLDPDRKISCEFDDTRQLVIDVTGATASEMDEIRAELLERRPTPGKR